MSESGRFRLLKDEKESASVFAKTPANLYPAAMTTEQIHDHIWIDPARCGGRPCVRGHRIWVSMVLDLLADGLTPQEITAGHYPQITLDDIHACIAYGAAMSHERFVPVALEPVA